MTMPLRCSAGELTYIEVLKDGINEVESLDGVYSVTVGPDEKYVYDQDLMTMPSRLATEILPPVP